MSLPDQHGLQSDSEEAMSSSSDNESDVGSEHESHSVPTDSDGVPNFKAIIKNVIEKGMCSA